MYEIAVKCYRTVHRNVRRKKRKCYVSARRHLDYLTTTVKYDLIATFTRLLAIIFICPLVFHVGIGLVATVVYKCKKMNTSRYALLGRNTDLVTENQLNILAGKLGMEWEHVAIHLGMTKADVDRFIRDNERDMRGQAFNMLITWKNNNGERATIAALIEQLKSFKLDLEKYRFLEESSDSN